MRGGDTYDKTELTKLSLKISREVSDEAENNDNVVQNLKTENNEKVFNNNSNSVEKNI